MDSPYFRTVRARPCTTEQARQAGDAQRSRVEKDKEEVIESNSKGKQREVVDQLVGGGEDSLSGASSETVLTRSQKAPKILGRWRHVMEVPEDRSGDCADKLWEFVAAHVEDKWRKKPCSLAQKVWKLLTQKAMVGYRARQEGEVDGIPVGMPGRLASWRRSGPKGEIHWSEK